MILFLGDSYTWGQGLEWEYLLQNNLTTIEEINKIIPPQLASERLPFTLSEFRRENRFAHKVAKHFNIPYKIGRYGNGGGNSEIEFILSNLEKFIHPENLDIIIVQFTHIGRDLPYDFNGNVFEYWDELTNRTLSVLKEISKHYKINYACTSWLIEPSESVNRTDPKSLIKLLIDNDEKISFEEINGCLHEKYNGLKDGHLSLEGHDIVANSIINHLEKNNLYQKNKLTFPIKKSIF